MERASLDNLKKKSKSIKKEIIDSITLFNELRKNRSKFNSIVKENKEKRGAIVKEIKSLISDLKLLNKEKEELVGGEDARLLKKLIDKKEWFFQINVLSIKKEEKIMKELKTLNSKLKKAKRKGIVFKSIKKIIYKLAKARKKHNNIHSIVIKTAEDSDTMSKKMRALQKKIKVLKKDGKEVNSILKKELYKKKNQMIDYKKKSALRKKKKELVIKQKQDEVMKKLKNKKKLTNEDLILFQN